MWYAHTLLPLVTDLVTQYPSLAVSKHDLSKDLQHRGHPMPATYVENMSNAEFACLLEDAGISSDDFWDTVREDEMMYEHDAYPEYDYEEAHGCK